MDEPVIMSVEPGFKNELRVWRFRVAYEGVYWTVGEYDGECVYAEAPSEKLPDKVVHAAVECADAQRDHAEKMMLLRSMALRAAATERATKKSVH